MSENEPLPGEYMFLTQRGAAHQEVPGLFETAADQGQRLRVPQLLPRTHRLHFHHRYCSPHPAAYFFVEITYEHRTYFERITRIKLNQ